SLALYFATTPQALYQTLACDSQSYASVILSASASVSCVLLSLLSAPQKQRLIAATAAAAALSALFYFYAKPCIMCGPFAVLPEDLREKWLSNVFEAIGLGKHLQGDFLNNLAFLGSLVVSAACVIAAFFFTRNDRWRWALLCGLV